MEPASSGGVDLDRFQTVRREFIRVDRDGEIAQGVGPVGRNVCTRHFGGVKTTDDLPERRVRGRFINDRDASCIPKRTNLTEPVNTWLRICDKSRTVGSRAIIAAGIEVNCRGNSIGPMLMAYAPSPKVVANMRSGSGVVVDRPGRTDLRGSACPCSHRYCPATRSSSSR